MRNLANNFNERCRYTSTSMGLGSLVDNDPKQGTTRTLGGADDGDDPPSLPTSSFPSLTDDDNDHIDNSNEETGFIILKQSYNESTSLKTSVFPHEPVSKVASREEVSFMCGQTGLSLGKVR